MPPRSLSNLSVRSPICVSRWDDTSCGSSVEYTTKNKDGSVPLVKSVSFAEHNQVFEITHLNDIPPDEVKSIWYDPDEYSQIKKDYQLTIFLMESGEALTGDDHSSRGLEYRTQEGAWARYENKRDAYNAVLDEQDRQWKEDVDDWESIRRVYLEHSTKCQKAALDRGIKDDEEIADYKSEPLELQPKTEKKLKKKKKVVSADADKEEKAKGDKEKDKDKEKPKKKVVKSSDKEKTTKTDKEKTTKTEKEKTTKTEKEKTKTTKSDKEKVPKSDKEKSELKRKKEEKERRMSETSSSSESSAEQISRERSPKRTEETKKSSKLVKEKRHTV